MEQNINITPARNTNNTIIEKATKELEDLFERLSIHEKENPGETFGYAGIPYCLKRTREKGINKIFFVGRDYHGKYEDDYCYFTYWDEDSKEFFEDEWGTWAAFPHYDLYEMPIDFGTAWEEGLIDKDAYLEYQKKVNLDYIENVEFDGSIAENFNLRVKIEKGRKWKGEGYLVDVTSSSYRFATPMFRNHRDDYGIETTYTAVIWDPITNTINRANRKYVEFIDQELILESYKSWAKDRIEHARIMDIKHNGNYNRGSFIIDIDYSWNTFFAEVWAPAHNIGDVISSAYDPEMEEKKKKESEFRASKMPGIIEWVKNNTDKKGEEIITLALHIYNKNYGK